MKNLFLLFNCLLIFNSGFSQSISPEVFASAGKNEVGQNLLLDWTLGEPLIDAYENGNSQLTQGFHQPVYTLTSISEIPVSLGKITIVGNPTTDLVTWEADFTDIQEVEVSLFDSVGKLLKTSKFQDVSRADSESLSSLPSGTYFLVFRISNNSFQKTFKILKIS